MEGVPVGRTKKGIVIICIQPVEALMYSVGYQ